MYIDSNLYINFHRYIDVISCNKHYFKIEDLKNVKELKSIYSITEPTIDISNFNHKFQDISIANWKTICNNINHSQF